MHSVLLFRFNHPSIVYTRPSPLTSSPLLLLCFLLSLCLTALIIGLWLDHGTCRHIIHSLMVVCLRCLFLVHYSSMVTIAAVAGFFTRVQRLSCLPILENTSAASARIAQLPSYLLLPRQYSPQGYTASHLIDLLNSCFSPPLQMSRL